MVIKEKQINVITLSVSVLIHASIFMWFTNSALSQSLDQAPVYDTRVSLNFLPPEKQTKQIVTDPKPIKPKNKAKKKIKKKKEKKQKKQSKSEKIVAPKIAEKIQRKQKGDLASIKQYYFSTLLTHIEGYKYYPRSARQRGVEGSIKISFRLLADGSITGLTANGGPLILRRAAKSSVTDALPLPLCPEDVTCPMQVSYAMQFKLN